MTEIEFHRDLTGGGLLRAAEAQRVAEALAAGHPAVLPTETGYMLAARATDRDAVHRVFAIKGRPLAQAMHVACASLDMARAYSAGPELGLHLLGRLTPGPFSVVVTKNDRLPDDLVTVDGTVGLRIPDAAATLQVVAALGEPVTATSFNRSGEEHLGIDLEALDTLPWAPGSTVHVVDVGDHIPYSRASTLVRVTTGEVEVLREGPVDRATIVGAARM